MSFPKWWLAQFESQVPGSREIVQAWSTEERRDKAISPTDDVQSLCLFAEMPQFPRLCHGNVNPERKAYYVKLRIIL